MQWKKAVLGTLLGGFVVACSDQQVTGPESATAAPQAAAARQTQTLIENVTGTVTGGTFTGTAQITNFAVQNGQLLVSGVLNGVVDIGGTLTNVVNQAFTVAADLTGGGGGKCEILHLDLGPIHLDLLGLNVDLNEVILDVSAQSGAGNLLGNLLCAVTHLLDNPLANLAGILNILNQINSILGSL